MTQPPQHPRHTVSPNPAGPWQEHAGPYSTAESARPEAAAGWGNQQPRGAAPPQHFPGPVPQQQVQGGYYDQSGNLSPGPPQYGQQQYAQQQYGQDGYGLGGYGNAAYTPKRTSSSMGMWHLIGLLFLAVIISAVLHTPATGWLVLAAVVLLGAKIIGGLAWDGPSYGTPSHGINRYGKSVPLGDINR